MFWKCFGLKALRTVQIITIALPALMMRRKLVDEHRI